MTPLSNKEIIDNVFNSTLESIKEGLPIDICQDFLEYNEEIENYLVCAGIKKAIDWYEIIRLTETIIKIEKLKTNKQ